MAATLVNKSNLKTSTTPASILYYKMEGGGMAVLEMPEDVNIFKVKSVVLHLSKNKSQKCSLNQKPASQGIYTICNKCIGGQNVSYELVAAAEEALRKQLNMVGKYVYTLTGAQISGD